MEDKEIKELKDLIMQYAMKVDVISNNAKKQNGNNVYKNIIYYIGFFMSIITFLFSFVKIYFTDLTDIKMRLTRIETKIEIQEKNK